MPDRYSGADLPPALTAHIEGHLETLQDPASDNPPGALLRLEGTLESILLLELLTPEMLREWLRQRQPGAVEIAIEGQRVRISIRGHQSGRETKRRIHE